LRIPNYKKCTNNYYLSEARLMSKFGFITFSSILMTSVLQIFFLNKHFFHCFYFTLKLYTMELAPSLRSVNKSIKDRTHRACTRFFDNTKRWASKKYFSRKRFGLKKFFISVNKNTRHCDGPWLPWPHSLVNKYFESESKMNRPSERIN